MNGALLTYIDSFLPFGWGIAHLVPMRNVVAAFGANKGTPCPNHLRLYIIRSLFKCAAEPGYLARNPASKPEMLRIASTGGPDVSTDDELQAIWNNVDSHRVDPLKFIFLTGLRKAELIEIAAKA